MGPEQNKQCGGFTMIEMMVSLVVMSMAFSAFLGVALKTVRDYEFFTAMHQISQWNQQVVNDIRKDTLSTKIYLDMDTVGMEYYSALNLPGDRLPISTTRLPLVEEDGVVEKDTLAHEKTGNSLFFVKTLAVGSGDAVYSGPDEDFIREFTVQIGQDAEDTATYRINAYRFVLYYLMMKTGDSIGSSPDSLDLIRWASIPVADYGQVMAIPESVLDEDSGMTFYPREQLVAQFVDDYESHFLWDSSEDIDNAFYYCDEVGHVSSMPESDMIIDQDPEAGICSMIPGGGMRSGKRTSICMNDGTPNFQAGPVVPLYAVADFREEGFPHGFEVQIVGPSGARKLLVRLAMAKEGFRSILGKDFRAVLTTRDY